MLILTMCLSAIGNSLDSSRIISIEGINMMIILARGKITGVVIIMLSLVEI